VRPSSAIEPSRSICIPRRSACSRFTWFDENETVDFVEGAFVIDAFEATTGELVYHGAAHAEIDQEHVDLARLTSAVDDVMEDFPARPGRD
jgi:hypothetical protein